jgi:hypothetical protein
MDPIENRKWLRKAEERIYNCMMETAWNWNGRPAEDVRLVYEDLIQYAIEDMACTGFIEQSAYDLLAAIQSIKSLDNEDKTAVMKAMHYAAQRVYKDIGQKVTLVEKEIEEGKLHKM